MNAVGYIEKAQTKLVLDVMNDKKDETQAVTDLNGMLLVLDEVDASKAPKLKEEAAALRTSINNNIARFGGASAEVAVTAEITE